MAIHPTAPAFHYPSPEHADLDTDPPNLTTGFSFEKISFRHALEDIARLDFPPSLSSEIAFDLIVSVCSCKYLEPAPGRNTKITAIRILQPRWFLPPAPELRTLHVTSGL